MATEATHDVVSEGKQAFFSKLPASLETLCSLPCGLQDDTILHRLLDLIKRLVVTREDVTASGLAKFLVTVTEKPSDVHTSVVVLALGSAAHLVSTTVMDDDLRKTVTRLYDAVQGSRVLDNSSVGAAFFNGLAFLTSCPSGLQWLDKNSVHVQAALSTLETARSIFLLNAVENFLVAVVTHALAADSTHAQEDHPSRQPVTLSSIQEYLTRVLSDTVTNKPALLDQLVTASNPSNLLLVTSQIIRRLSDTELFCQRKAGDTGFFAALVHLSFFHPDSRIQQSTLRSLINMFTHMEAESQVQLLSEKVLPPLMNLLAEGEVERGVGIAASFVDSACCGDSQPMLTLKAVRRLPHDAVFSQEPASPQLTGLVRIVTTALSNRQALAKLSSTLLHSLKETQNSSGLVRLLQSASAVREDGDWQSLQSTWPPPVGAAITGNIRLLGSLLQCLQNSTCPALGVSDAVAVLNSLLTIMGRPQVDSRVVTQATEAFLAVLQAQCHAGITSSDAGIRGVLGRLVTLLERNLVSMQWEIRDSTLEFISKLVVMAHQEHHVLRQAWSCLQDGESYPRASTIAMATTLRQTPGWWNVFLNDCETTEMAVIEQMAEVLADSDTHLISSSAPPGGPSRREAVRLLSAIYQQSLPGSADLRQVICATLKSALRDSDWEVKVKALEFFELVLSPLLCSDADGVSSDTQRDAKPTPRKHKHDTDEETKSGGDLEILASLLETGLEEALFTAAEDYDNSVSEKACDILLRLQECTSLPQHSLSKLRKRHESHMGPNCAGDSITKPGQGENGSHVSSSCDKDAVQKFLTRVDEFDPAQHLQKLTVSMDEYDRQPESLLEDIVAAAKMAVLAKEAAFTSGDEFDDGEDIFVDCY
ncbi:hypothetical protein BaRGS_00001011 [Batillaria attramentaria]|uniref:Uncharacterized protein n=1 Tax=Batillaria attramentaria TaxID=370345 RepID=A0ABD0M9D1_9CAEN